MITFILTFLLSFNIIPEANLIKQKKTKKKVKQKKKRKGEENQTETQPKITKDYELESGKLISSIRIEYELIPKKFKYGIDIICWENLAKIITSDGFRYYKTLKDGNVIWVPLTIFHFIKKMSEIELTSLHGHIINFTINVTKKDNIPKFLIVYCKKKEATSENFVEYFEEDPNLVRKRSGKTEKSELRSAARKCSSEGSSSLLKFSDVTHSYMVYYTISSAKKGSLIKCKEFNALPSGNIAEQLKEKKIEKKKSKKKRKNKKKKKGKEKKKGDPHFILQGEVFFTDPRLAVYKLRDASYSLTNGFIFLTVDNLMTREQKSSLNPFIVKLKKLQYLPADILREYGYEKIFISFEIPDLVEFESLPKPIQENIDFDDCRAYFSKDVARLKFLEFIRSERVKVKINAIMSEKRIQPLLFGTNKEDTNLSHVLQPREAYNKLRTITTPPKIQVVCVANFDISSLLKDVWTFREEAPCYHPDSLLYGLQKKSSRKFVDLYTAAETNFGILDIEENTSPLFDGVLASISTTLDMEFHFVAPQFVKMHLQTNNFSFKRLFLIVYDRYLAHNILASTIEHNESFLGLNAILSSYVSLEDRIIIELKKRVASRDFSEFMELVKLNSAEVSDDVHRDVLTGFMIDNGLEIYFFIEGLRHGFILEIWNMIHKVNPYVARVFFNSENEYLNRIYDGFISTGLLKITLKKSLQSIFNEQCIYIEGSIPLPCYKVNISYAILYFRRGSSYYFHLFHTY
ncbi:hypothetical protein WA026_014335 [Henosepilachna vigintioctopunctata]|uniref:DUF4550 domain-containing protein n=1 Tax=Henosepilachna vigintioctopunctata TaxID=420089 RepID=A0AAW1UKC5_9CUCU